MEKSNWAGPILKTSKFYPHFELKMGVEKTNMPLCPQVSKGHLGFLPHFEIKIAEKTKMFG